MLSSYIISLVCPVVVVLSIHPSRHPSSSSWKKKMMEEEEDDDEWRPQPFIQMFMWSAKLACEPVGGEEVGLLWVMTATGVGLSLALNTVVASTYPSLAVVLQPCVSLNSQQTLQWDCVVGENYSNKKKIFKALSTFSSSSFGATTRLSLRFPHQQGCKEKQVPLAQVRRLPFCLFSLVDVDGIITRVVCLLLSGHNFKALLLQHHNNKLAPLLRGSCAATRII